MGAKGKGVKEHIHIYVQFKLRPGYWRCADDCTHFLPKEQILGKMSRCPCGNTFIIVRDDLRRVWPKCPDCRNTKDSRMQKQMQAIVSTIYSGDKHSDLDVAIEDNKNE